MCPEGGPKFLPGDNMSSRMHSAKIIPPNTSSTTKLLGSKVNFTRVCTRYSKKGELRFNSMKPGIKSFGTRVPQVLLLNLPLLLLAHLAQEEAFAILGASQYVQGRHLILGSSHGLVPARSQLWCCAGEFEHHPPRSAPQVQW
jgi:hypothetical protein